MSLKDFYAEKVKPKIESGVKKTKEVCGIVVDTVKENPMLPLMIIQTITPIIVEGIHSSTVRQTKQDDRLMTHDAFTDTELTTTHELTNEEILEVTERMKNGQKKAEALDEMGLLEKSKRNKK